jgi:CBS-domain-containing membrane protein
VYRLLTGAVVLIVVVPVWVSGHTPMWPVSISTVLVVGAAAMFPRTSRLRAWFQHHRA